MIKLSRTSDEASRTKDALKATGANDIASSGEEGLAHHVDPETSDE